MKHSILNPIFIAFLLLGLCVPQVDASVIRGKRYYIQLLKKPCGFDGAKMGSMHTSFEWREFYKKGMLQKAIKNVCPKAPEKLSAKQQKNLYHFLSSFASDSGNVPSCN